MANNIMAHLGISETDLTVPTPTRKYALGEILTVQDTTSKNAVKQYMYVKASSALTQYQPYVINYGATEGSEVVTASPSTKTSGVTVCVPQVSFTSGYYGFVQILGECTALLINERHVIGDFLELLDAGTGFVVDGTSGSTTQSEKSLAVQKTAKTGAGSATVFLFGGVGTSMVSAE